MDAQEIRALLGKSIFERAQKYRKRILQSSCTTNEDGVRHLTALVQGSGHALLAGQPGGLVQHHKGSIFVENVHSLPSSSRALSLSTPAMVLPSLISPRMTIS